MINLKALSRKIKHAFIDLLEEKLSLNRKFANEISSHGLAMSLRRESILLAFSIWTGLVPVFSFYGLLLDSVLSIVIFLGVFIMIPLGGILTTRYTPYDIPVAIFAYLGAFCLAGIDIMIQGNFLLYYYPISLFSFLILIGIFIGMVPGIAGSIFLGFLGKFRKTQYIVLALVCSILTVVSSIVSYYIIYEIETLLSFILPFPESAFSLSILEIVVGYIFAVFGFRMNRYGGLYLGITCMTGIIVLSIIPSSFIIFGEYYMMFSIVAYFILLVIIRKKDGTLFGANVGISSVIVITNVYAICLKFNPVILLLTLLSTGSFLVAFIRFLVRLRNYRKIWNAIFKNELYMFEDAGWGEFQKIEVAGYVFISIKDGTLFVNGKRSGLKGVRSATLSPGGRYILAEMDTGCIAMEVGRDPVGFIPASGPVGWKGDLVSVGSRAYKFLLSERDWAPAARFLRGTEPSQFSWSGTLKIAVVWDACAWHQIVSELGLEKVDRIDVVEYVYTRHVIGKDPVEVVYSIKINEVEIGLFPEIEKPVQEADIVYIPIGNIDRLSKYFMEIANISGMIVMAGNRKIREYLPARIFHKTKVMEKSSDAIKEVVSMVEYQESREKL